MELTGSDGVGTPNPSDDAQTRHFELVALSQVSAALSGLWDLDAILRVALDNMLNVMNGTIGGILLPG